MIFAYGTVTLFGIPFQNPSANQTSSKCSPSANPALSTKTERAGLLTLFPYNPHSHLTTVRCSKLNIKYQKLNIPITNFSLENL